MMHFLKRLIAAFNPPLEEFEDPVIGLLLRRGGDWHCNISFDHPPTGAKELSLLIDSGKGHPTEEQRALFLDILSRYHELWPRVAQALANYHPIHHTPEEVERHIDEPCLCLEPIIAGQPAQWSLQYTFDYPDEADMGYFVNFREWEIEGVQGVD